jgi:pseudouridine synthase
MKQLSLERYLVLSGKGNRRQCSFLIRQGEVSVNAKIIKDPKKKINLSDEVLCDKEILKASELKSFLLWKPPGYICQTGEQDACALELLPDVPGLSLVGRLDKDSEGLIIASNDGELSHLLTHPDSHISKVYHVKINGRITDNNMRKLCSGLTLDGKKTRSIDGKVLRKEGKYSHLELCLTEGKKRQIRRLLEMVDKKVLRLLRVSIGTLNTANLKEGQYRELEAEEISSLLKLSDEKKGTEN